MPRVLVTGGRGLIGQHLCRMLREKGYEVALLSRSDKKGAATDTITWDIERGVIDRDAISGCDYIIHLAGANMGGKRWSAKRKQEISDSRIRSSRLIFDSIDTGNRRLKAFISASAIGYYGAVTSEHIFVETDPPGNDFLGQICREWELAADRFASAGIRIVKIRTGIVLSKEGGALSRLTVPVRLGFGSAIGNGKQYMPWIHMDDLCGIYIHALENPGVAGTYNAVAPEHVQNKEFTRELARVLHRPFWFPNIPAFILKLLFGEMAVMLLSGSRVSSEKIAESGYSFRHPGFNEALKEIYSG